MVYFGELFSRSCLLRLPASTQPLPAFQNL